jgi:hypothetical protein
MDRHLKVPPARLQRVEGVALLASRTQARRFFSIAPLASDPDGFRASACRVRIRPTKPLDRTLASMASSEAITTNNFSFQAKGVALVGACDRPPDCRDA